MAGAREVEEVSYTCMKSNITSSQGPNVIVVCHKELVPLDL